jgi:hypothetical protein
MDESLTDSERILLILDKGTIEQKRAALSNTGLYIENDSLFLPALLSKLYVRFK